MAAMPHAVYERIYESQPDEHAFAIERVSGTIPTDLAGTFLRSGPGLMQLGEHDLNFFDGHALIAGVTFEGGKARFRSRFVRSPLYESERREKRILKRRILTNHPSRWANLFALEFGNSAMHDVYAWGEGEHQRVIAANDPGHFALDPETLETKGPETWDGAVQKGWEMGPMPYRDPHSGHLIGWIKKPGKTKPDEIKLVELDGSFRTVKETPFAKLATSPAIVHDQRATAKWYVAAELPVRLKLAQALWGKSTVFDALATPPGATATMLLHARDGGSLIRVPLPAGNELVFHVINAYDDGARVVVDMVSYDGPIAFSAARRNGPRSHGPSPRPIRFVVDPAKAATVEHRRLVEAPGEAPEVADDVMGKPYRYAYYPTVREDDAVPDRGFYAYYGSIAKADVESGKCDRHDAAEGTILSPPAFVRRSDESEDDGWLLSYALREDGARVIVLDARDLAKGPVATLELGLHLPGVSHTRWSPDVRLAV